MSIITFPGTRKFLRKGNKILLLIEVNDVGGR